MTVHIDIIKEEHYTLEIDISEEQEDALYDELSCHPCMEDMFDVECFLEDKGVKFEKYTDNLGESRVETWR